jgi:hypothetical protein
MIHDTPETAAKCIQRMINLAAAYRKEARGGTAKSTSWPGMNRLRCIQRALPTVQPRHLHHWMSMAAGNVMSVAGNSARDEAEAAIRCNQAEYLLAHMLDPTKT